MAMTALFRGKWGQKSQEPPEKRPAALVHSRNHEEDEEDDRVIAPIRRNSRFYRSMRKKRLAASEQPESKNRIHPSSLPLRISPSVCVFCMLQWRVIKFENTITNSV